MSEHHQAESSECFEDGIAINGIYYALENSGQFFGMPFVTIDIDIHGYLCTMLNLVGSVTYKQSNNILLYGNDLLTQDTSLNTLVSSYLRKNFVVAVTQGLTSPPDWFNKISSWKYCYNYRSNDFFEQWIEKLRVTDQIVYKPSHDLEHSLEVISSSLEKNQPYRPKVYIELTTLDRKSFNTISDLCKFYECSLTIPMYLHYLSRE